MNDPKRFHSFLEGQVKAMQVMGKTITTEQIYEASKYSKSAGSTLSDDFLNLTMPSLIQEMHGSSAGDALSAANKRLRGGLAHQHMAVLRLNQMGLLEDPKLIRRSKSGEILGYSGRLKGDDLIGTDIDKWFQTYFKNGAAKVGAKSLADINKLLAETLPSTAANLGRIFIQQEDTLKQHRRSYEAAAGLDESVKRQTEEWHAAVASLRASFSDLGSAATLPMLPAASKGISALAQAVKGLAAYGSDHPLVATGAAGVAAGAGLAGAGWLSYSLYSLGAAGPSLQTAAAMLQEAAVLQGATSKGKLPSVFGALPVAPTLAETAGGGVVGGAAGLGLGLGLGALAYLIKASHAAQQPGQGGAWAPATFETRPEDEEALADQRAELVRLKDQHYQEEQRTWNGQTRGFNINQQFLEDQIRNLENQISQREASLSVVPPFPVAPSGLPLPSMVNPEMPRYGRKGQPIYPGVSIEPIGGNVDLPTMAQVPVVAATGPLSVRPDYQLPSLPPPVQAPPVPAPVATVPRSLPPPVPAPVGTVPPSLPPTVHAPIGAVPPLPPPARAPVEAIPRSLPPPVPAPVSTIGAVPPSLPPIQSLPTFAQGPIDVTGRVAADVNVTTDGTTRVVVEASPLLLAKIENQTSVTRTYAKPSVGPSMAGIVHPAGRGD